MKTEGKNSLLELLKTSKTVDKILIQNGLYDGESKNLISEIKKSGHKYQFVDKAVLDKESITHRHQGFIAFVSDYEYKDYKDILQKVSEKDDALIVILDGIEDPHNLGSIIRVCECAGADGLIFSKRRSATVNETVMRVSEGSANHIDIARVTNINPVIDELKKVGVWVYGLELGGEDIYKTNLKGKVAIVVGGEDTGVNRLTKEKCDVITTIPMYGKVNSLNASVACGVAVFEKVRQSTK